MPATVSKRSGAQVAMPRPVERALRTLGDDLSVARRRRQMTQEDLAERVGASVNTIRRMEDGQPGTALHTLMRALFILGRLDAMLLALAPEKDALGLDLAREQLPKRVSSRRNRQVSAGDRVPDAGRPVRDDNVPAGGRPSNPDDLEGF